MSVKKRICSAVWAKLSHLELCFGKLKYHLFLIVWDFFFVFFCFSPQDFSVTFGHCPEITVYTSCCYFPSAGQLPGLWADHRKSLLSMLVEVSHSLGEEILARTEGSGMMGEEGERKKAVWRLLVFLLVLC